MLDKLWDLKNDVYFVLIKEYDDYTRFFITEHPYHLTTAKFIMYNYPHLNFDDRFLTNELSSLIVDNREIIIIGSGIDLEAAILNLIGRVIELTNNKIIEELVINYKEN